MPHNHLHMDVWALDAREQSDALDQYRAACAHMFDVTALGAADAFYNRRRGYNVSGVILGLCEGVAQRLRRNRFHLAIDTRDAVHVVLDFETEGWRGNYDGRPADSSQGSIRMMDLARPFEVTLSAFRALHVIVPRTLLGESGHLDLHGLVLSDSSVSGRMLAAHLKGLWDMAGDLTRAEAAGMAAATGSLVASAVARHAPMRVADARPVDKALLALARAFVDARLSDPDLKPQELLAHLGVSRSHMYQAFEPVGGVSQFIQMRRLDRAFDAIVSDISERQTLGEVAYAHGFRSDAHFNRMFRARFGMPPGRARRLGCHTPNGSAVLSERPDDLWHWLRAI